jgi:hypothetical protein
MGEGGRGCCGGVCNDKVADRVGGISPHSADLSRPAFSLPCGVLPLPDRGEVLSRVYRSPGRLRYSSPIRSGRLFPAGRRKSWPILFGSSLISAAQRSHGERSPPGRTQRRCWFHPNSPAEEAADRRRRSIAVNVDRTQTNFRPCLVIVRCFISYRHYDLKCRHNNEPR